MAREKTVENIVEELNKALETQHQASRKIKREGTIMILPEGMTNLQAISAIQMLEKEMESATIKRIKIKGHPADCLYSFHKAMEKTFGNLIGVESERQTFFGVMKIPGMSYSIKIGYDEMVSVPYGEVRIPGMPLKIRVFFNDPEEIGVENMMKKGDVELFVDIEYKKKLEPLVNSIEKATLQEMKEHSIFLGKAIDSKYEFLNLNGFPLDKIVYGEAEGIQLEANVFSLVEHWKEAKKIGVNLKRTILLSGRYGTGKTLTALKIANLAVQNGMTFIHIKPGDNIAEGLEFAKKYARPGAIAFMEDVDAQATGERNEGLNAILNTIDGILSKSTPVMCILTTNNAERIERAMLRPGRIDKIIEMGNLDRKQLQNLIEVYCGEQLSGEVDYEELSRESQGYTPSFITEACQQALLYALARMKGETKGLKITHADLRASLTGLRGQYNLMMAKVDKKSTLDDHFGDLIRENVSGAKEARA